MRVSRWALVALVLPAGCLDGPGDDTKDGAITPGPHAWGFEFSDPVKVAPTPNNQGEAVVSVSADGRVVLTCFHGLFSEVSPGYASTDSGVTWRRMEFPAEAGVGGDCETAITDSGAWVFLASTVAGATVLVSNDEGASWDFNPVTAIPVNGLADRPWLESVGDELWLAYMPLLVQPGTVGFVKSTDLGQSWSIPVLIGLPGPDETTVQHGHLTIDGDRVLLPMVRGSPTQTRVAQIASTTDGGETWAVEDVLRSNILAPDWPSLGRSASGDLFFLVTADTTDGSGTHLLHLAPGSQWSSPVFVNQGASWPWISGGDGRNATFIVGGNGQNDTAGIWAGRIDSSDLSIGQKIIGPGFAPEFASVDHDAAGNAYMVWVHASTAQYFVKGTKVPLGEGDSAPAQVSTMAL